jgi:nucleoid-associated protein YgaU
MNRKLIRLSVFVALAAAAPSVSSAQEWIDTGDEAPVGLGTVGLRREEEVPPAHTVQRGDTLWSISGRYYRNP